MNTLLKNGLLMAGFFLLTTFFVVYSMCGIVSNVTISILFGIFELAASGYYLYVALKKSETVKMTVLYYFVATASLLSAITNFSIHSKYFTDYSATTRFFIVIAISLGISANASVPWTVYTEKFMGDVIKENGLDEFKEQMIYLILNIIIQILQAFLMGSIPDLTEYEMVQIVCIRSLGTLFCSIIVGAAFGVYLGSKADSNIGYVSPDQE